MRYKILFISSWYPNLFQPTNGNFVQRHAESVALHHDVEVLHAIGDPKQKARFSLEEKVCGGVRTVIVYYRESALPALNFLHRMNAYRLGFGRMRRPDLVHANVLQNNLFFAVYLKKRYKIPFVVSEHWTGFLADNQHIASKMQLRFAKQIGRHAGYILPVSDVLLQSLKNHGIKAPMQVISNVVDTDLFCIKKEGSSGCRFVHISSLVARKNPLKIIGAVVKLRHAGYDVSLEIGGDGDLAPLNKMVAKENAQDFIHVFGALSYAGVAEKIQAADCFVLFSENETQGCVILESFSCGKPVISSAVGGVPEFLKPNFGRLIEAGSSTALYDAMRDFTLGKFPAAAPDEMRKYVLDNFSKEAISQKFSQIYKEVLAG